MKIAICMSGQIRTFKKCYKSLVENFIQNYDCDIFAVASNDENNEDLNLIPMAKKLTLKKDEMPFFDDNKYPKGWSNKVPRLTCAGILEQWWKMEKCFNLVEEYSQNNNIKYDFVVRCRFDTFYFQKMTPRFEELDENFLYLSLHRPPTLQRKFVDYYKKLDGICGIYKNDFVYDYGESDLHKLYFNVRLPDYFAISNMELMKIYSNKYSTFDNLFKNGCPFHAEISMYELLKTNKVPVKFQPPFYYINRG